MVMMKEINNLPTPFMGTAESSEKSVAFYQTTRCHIWEDGG